MNRVSITTIIELSIKVVKYMYEERITKAYNEGLPAVIELVNNIVAELTEQFAKELRKKDE